MKPIEAFYEESRVKANTRLQILHAAVVLMAKTRIADITIPAVAECAQLTARNVYRYYENRNYLLMDVFYMIFSKYSEREPIAFVPGTSGSTQLRRVIDYYILSDTRYEAAALEFSMSQGDMLRMMFEIDMFLYGLPEDDPAFERYKKLYVVNINTNMKQQLHDALRAGVQDKTLRLREEEVPFYAEYVIQAMRSIGTQVLLKQNERSTINQGLVQKAAEMIVYYLAAKETGDLSETTIED